MSYVHLTFIHHASIPPETYSSCLMPRAGFEVVRIDPLRFLARCRTKWLNQALSVLSLSLYFLSVSVVLLTRAPFCVVLFVCSVFWLFLLGCQYQCKGFTGKTRLRNDLYVLMWTLNPTQSFNQSRRLIITRNNCLFAWGLTALSAQIGYIAPQE